jgi:hypothetical protein
VQPFSTARAIEAGPNLAWVQIFYAAGAIFWLISLAQTAAVVAAPAGRAELTQQLSGTGIPRSEMAVALVVYCVGALLLAIVAAAIHGLAFYGLRGRKRWGWAAAVLVAGLWSLVLVGIPFLYVLLKRSTRRAYGLE